MPVDTEKGRTMRPFAHLMAALAALSARLEADDPERGDVPGWVMITVMTAIVVIALLAVFREQVINAVQNAFQSVTGAG